MRTTIRHCRRTPMALAGALEDSSEHPIAQTIAKGARDRVGDCRQWNNSPTRRTQDGGHSGRSCSTRRPHPLLADCAQHLPTELDDDMKAAEAAGRTAVAVGWNGAARAILDGASLCQGKPEDPSCRVGFGGFGK